MTSSLEFRVLKKIKYDRMATNMCIRSDNIEWGSGSASSFKYQLNYIRVGSLVNDYSSHPRETSLTEGSSRAREPSRTGI